MLKRFFISFLGTIAGFWVSIIVAAFAFFVMIGVAVASGSSGEKVSVKKHSILYLPLAGEVVDRETSNDVLSHIYGSKTETIALNDIVASLDAAAKDDRVDGVFIDCVDAAVGLADAQAVVNAIEKFKTSGKWVISYSDNYSQTNYFIACHADSVFLNPIGLVDIHGLASTTMYFKNLLDKLGVEMQVVKVGEYKSAVEPFLLTDMSAESRLQQQEFLDNLWSEMKNSMAEARDLKIESFNLFADSLVSMSEAQTFVKNGLVDGLRYRHEVEKLLANLTDADSYDDLRMVTPADYCSDSDIPTPKGKKTIAVLYAIGDIVDSGDKGIVGDKMVREILDLSEDEEIDGLILRVNSGGGSAFASEQIWEALEQYKAITGKPYYVSMADYAASGGYYISCGADAIYAEKLTLTGSIGIFGMMPCIKGTLSDKLGVNTATVQTNDNASFPSMYEPMTPVQRAAMQSNINRGYKTFVGRVAKGRGMTEAAVDSIARGRVWDGATAHKIGLVDKLGGLDAAIADMATALGVDIENCCIEEYPDVEFKWWEELFSLSQMKLKMWFMEDEFSPETLAIYRGIEQVKSMTGLQARMLPFDIY